MEIVSCRAPSECQGRRTKRGDWHGGMAEASLGFKEPCMPVQFDVDLMI